MISWKASKLREVGLKTRVFTSPAEGEVILYEAYFRRMRPTGITNLRRQPHGIPTLKKIAVNF